MDYSAQMRNDAQDKVMDELSRKLDRAFEHVDNNRDSLTQLRTVLLGVDGTNGVKGDLKELQKQFSAYRLEIRKEIKDVSDTLIEMVNNVNRDIEKARKERRKEFLATIGVLITAIGLIVRFL